MLRRAHIALVFGAATLMLVAAAPAAHAAPADAVTQRPCFGAASRDAAKPCPDPALRLTIFPTPADAVLEPNARCHPTGRTKLLYPCRFGIRPVAKAPPVETIGLVGDSHAAHWRAALEVVATAKRRPAISLARAGCPFLDAAVDLPAPARRACWAWNREVRAYLTDHREITTLFVSASSSATVIRDRGKSNFQTQVSAHISLWRKLPDSIRHIVVIRDTPRSSAASALCVQRAYASKREAGRRCARSRRHALHPDAGVEAARRIRSRRVRAIDLTRFFCNREYCFPVIGGAHVYKDVDHMTAAYARTLGPYLLRSYDEILRTTAGGERGPLDDLLPDERAAAECLLRARLLASGPNGFQNLSPEQVQIANGCRAMLERRAAELKAAGLSGERNRDRRYAVIVAVLDT